MKKNDASEKKRRFIIVGMINTAIDFGILFILSAFGLQSIVANFISTSLAFSFSFTANRNYTFKAHDQHLVRQITLFIIVTLFGLWCIQPVIIWLSTVALSGIITSQWALLFTSKCLATGVTLVWNYLIYSRVVFSKKNTEKV
ncbi:MAG TPA: GtrA family protein [Candidatus Saccharimonadales bacterium]